jgi:hypothetical protein
MEQVETLDKACETAGQWVLDRARESAASGGIPTLLENRTQYEENRFTHGARAVPAPWLLIRRLYDREIWRRPEIRSWIRLHLEAGLLPASPGVSFDQASDDNLRNWAWILLNPLTLLIEKRGTLNLSSAEIVEIYSLFREASRGTIRCEVIVPLLGVEGDLPNPLKLGNVYQLSRFTPQEKNRLAGRWLNQGIITERALHRSKFKLSFEEIYKQPEQEDFQQTLQTEVELIITALRLAASGRVGAPALFENREVSGLGITAQNLPNLDVPEVVMKPLLLDADTVRRTRENYGLLAAANDGTSKFQLDVSLRRFNQAYSRDNLEDQVLDYTIALESCLLRGLSDELSYRFSIRGATVAMTKRDPVQTQSDLKRIYAARSKIVHNGRMPDPDLVQLCNDLSRVILLCYLERLADGRSVKAISDDLDLQVVRSLHVTQSKS